MIGAVLVLGIIVAAVVLVGRRMSGKQGPGGPPDIHMVRRFFQYLLLFGLLVVTASGLSGLLGRALERGALVSGDQSELALSVAFTVVGLPLYAVLALWSRKRLAEDPREASSLGWTFYSTVAALTTLSVTMFALHDVLAWATQLEPYSGAALARFVVWGALWAGHWWLGTHVTPVSLRRVHLLLGSLIGLVTSVTGLSGMLAGVIRLVLGFDEGQVLAGPGDPILRGAVTFAVGAPVWALYWLRTTSHMERDPLWLGYVLLAGVGGGLVTAITSASTVLYDVLVWLLGEPATTSATVHFQGVPTAAAAAVVGTVVWWYHHTTLEEAGPVAGGRTEIRRVYEYLMAGIALLAAAGGLTMAVAALVEAATGSSAVLVGQSAVNSLLAAATLLLVGGPVWWFYWRAIQYAARALPEAEHTSPTRRIYLFVLFGLGGVAAVIALLIGVYLLFEDILAGTFGSETIRSMRYAVGVLLTSGTVSAYHWTVYRAEREQVVATGHGPRFVLLVGPPDPQIARAVARSTGGRVQAWPRADGGGSPWSLEELQSLLSTATNEELIVLSDATGLHAIPIHRA